MDNILTSSTHEPGTLGGVMLVSHGNRGLARLPDNREIEVLYRRGVGRPVCGDRVQLDEIDSSSAAVAAIEERKNMFARADSRQRMQVVAANLDLVLIVLAAEPAPSRDLLERYLVAAHSLGITPAIVINKTDLEHSLSSDEASPFSRLDGYLALGYSVVKTSCKSKTGVEALHGVLAGNTSILVGQSGVGKSSLVNELVPDLELQTNALSRSTGKGRHTTTSTMMYQLPGSGGHLVDSPGVWEYGLWQLDDDQLESGFIEFGPHLGNCKFNNCLHDSEPDCAVKAAVEDGSINRWRYEAYLRLLREQ